MDFTEKNEKLALDIVSFLIEHELGLDTRVYYNGKCAENADRMITGIVGSDYFEYANDQTVSMSFEGSLNHLLNDWTYDRKLREKFDKIFEKHKCYYEQGNAWNLAVYYDEEESQNV